MPVYRDEVRGTWFVKYRYKDWRGDLKNSTKRGFKTKREATEWERNFQVLQAGNLEMTLPEFLPTYMADLLPRLKESTKDSKKNIIYNKLLPDFSNKRMCDIKPSDVVQWQNELINYRDPVTGKPYSTSYLQSIHTQLSAIFNHAQKYYGLKSNPARTVGNMKGPKGQEMQIWTLEDYKRFSAKLVHDPIAYHAFEVLYWTGMRKGEMLALTKDDFDFAEQTVRINKTYHRIRGKDIITTPKTNKSNRTITLPDALCAELQSYFARHYDLQGNDRVFPLPPSSVNTIMKRAIKEADLHHIRVHDLRHSHVSLLIEMGFSAVAIAQRVGHETIEITYRYAHLLPNVQGELASKLDQLKTAS